MHIVIIHCAVKAEHRQEFVTRVGELIRVTRGEAGNIAYGCFEDPGASGRMTFVEEWRGRGDIDAHMAQPYTQAFLQVALPMLAERPSMRVFEVARSETLM
jgi:quinol monooxygenase YgiN